MVACQKRLVPNPIHPISRADALITGFARTMTGSALALAALMALLSASIIHQDWRTTHVSVWKLLALLLLAVLWTAAAPFWDTPRMEHLIGGVMAGLMSALAALVVGKAAGRIAFGGADVWILAAGGFVLGMQWTGPWIAASVVLGIAAFGLGHQRRDPELDDGRSVLPFAPILLATFLTILAGRMMGWLPARPF